MQVFDLSNVKPHEFVQYGLSCLENLASLGDFCAKEIREKIRIMVCSLWHVNMITLLLDPCNCDHSEDVMHMDS